MYHGYLTVAETAELLRGSQRWVRARIKDGSIPHIRVGGKILIPGDQIRNMPTAKGPAS